MPQFTFIPEKPPNKILYPIPRSHEASWALEELQKFVPLDNTEDDLNQISTNPKKVADELSRFCKKIKKDNLISKINGTRAVIAKAEATLHPPHPDKKSINELINEISEIIGILQYEKIEQYLQRIYNKLYSINQLFVDYEKHAKGWEHLMNTIDDEKKAHKGFNLESDLHLYKRQLQNLL